MEKLVLGILAHVDAGKTTLSEALLFHGGQINKIGRVDSGDTFLDTNEIEKERGITIFSKQCILERNQKTITLLDTPGHMDFQAEMERTLKVLDYAVIIISGSEGVQSHTKTIWKLLEKHKIPTFIFVNKMDLVYKESYEIIDDLQKEIDGSIIDFSTRRDESLYKETIAMSYDSILDVFLETGNIDEEKMKEAIKERKIFPCYFGSALKNEGVEEVLSGMFHLTEGKSQREGKLSARAYKIMKDEKGVRLAFLKITKGSLKVKDTLQGDGWEEKINQIRIYQGNKYKNVEIAEAGSICAVAGINNILQGDVFGEEVQGENEVLESVLSYSVIIKDGSDPFIAHRKIKELEEEDPKLRVSYNEKAKVISIMVMGELQMEILRDIIKSRYNIDIEFGNGEIIYKETINKAVQTKGIYEYGNLETKVTLKFEPGERSSGIVIDVNSDKNSITDSSKNIILEYLNGRLIRGILTNSQVVDIKITLIECKIKGKGTDSYHIIKAVNIALRSCLLLANSYLLEPYYTFTIEVPKENVGKVMTDLSQMGATQEVPLAGENSTILKGVCPVEKIRYYQNELKNFTKGQGKIFLTYSGYNTCLDEEKVIQKNSYSVEERWGNIIDIDSLVNELEEEKENKNLQPLTKSSDKKQTSQVELDYIFEKTYGKIKDRSNRQSKIIKAPEKENFTFTPHTAKQNDEYLLIDGYNVMHKWENLKQLLSDSYSTAREVFIEILANHKGFTGKKIAVIFDGYRVKGSKGNQEIINGVEVIYTKEGETADTYIEKTTREMSKKYKVRVVTSDALEQLIILGYGGLRVSPTEFFEEIKEANRQMEQYK